MTTGWISAKLEDNLGILMKKNTDEFALFIKEQSLVEENVLIRFIAARLSMSNDVECWDMWLTEKGYCYPKNKIYLWIKKSALQKVVANFRFNFELKSCL